MSNKITSYIVDKLTNNPKNNLISSSNIEKKKIELAFQKTCMKIFGFINIAFIVLLSYLFYLLVNSSIHEQEWVLSSFNQKWVLSIYGFFNVFAILMFVVGFCMVMINKEEIKKELDDLHYVYPSDGVIQALKEFEKQEEGKMFTQFLSERNRFITNREFKFIKESLNNQNKQVI